jgi:3-keto-disaccharide hydrolase
MMRRVIGWSAAAILAVGVVAPALARPQYLMTFKAHYNTAQGKPTLNAANCSLCHIGMPAQRMWNPWGQAVRTALAGATNVQDRPKIVAALQAAEKGRNTAANKTYLELINADTLPATAGAPPATGTPGPAAVSPPQQGWLALFNGQDMSGWTKMNAGNWEVKDGILTYTGQGGNGWLRSNKQFKNYALVMVWRYPQAGANDSGLFLRAGMEGNPWPSSNVQLNMGPGQNFGSLSAGQGHRARADLIKPNDWNTYQVTVYNGTAALAINNQVAWEGATGIPDQAAFIGIQAEGRALEIGQLWIMELP